MKTYILSSLVLLGMISCNTGDKSEPAIKPEETTSYELVWSDEFDYSGQPDTAKWNREYGFWRNEESQYYTDSLKNARVEDGNLIIEAVKEQIANETFISPEAESWKDNREFGEYTAASLTTKGVAKWTYGKIEISAKLPEGRGMWPAVWMLGENEDEVGWPLCGEIDIMEHVGLEKNTIYGTVHTEAFNHLKGTEKGGSVFIADPYSDFHVYAVEWTPEKIDFLLDGEVYQQFINENKTTAEWPFDQAFNLKLNVAVGGGWGGQQGIDNSVFPQQMVVDYVRVYQLK